MFAEDEAALLLAAADGDMLDALVMRREAGEPLEHVLGWVDFGGLRLSVGPGAFIPRQRSVRLARAAVKALEERERPVGRAALDDRARMVFVEPFAGVAPLAATVAGRVPTAEVHAIELEPVALGYAARNLPPTAHRYQGSRLDPLPPDLAGRVSVIAAVPPYIPDAELGLLPRDFREHEPVAALTAGADGLDEVRALLDAALIWLAPDGVALIELNRRQASAAVAHARGLGLRANCRTASDGQTATLRAARAQAAASLAE